MRRLRLVGRCVTHQYVRRRVRHSHTGSSIDTGSRQPQGRLIRCHYYRVKTTTQSGSRIRAGLSAVASRCRISFLCLSTSFQPTADPFPRRAQVSPPAAMSSLLRVTGRHVRNDSQRYGRYNVGASPVIQTWIPTAPT